MNIGRTALSFAKQIPIHIADAGQAARGAAIDAYEKLAWH